ncbi:unnamed protein product [Rotaria sordida]|uniref:Uncharacterized protein n=1 Tax=Rotaria sordida TaxID=392033 RepID=A0A814T089_9BILA|nr:unnamed protein product [Rotaria sordida]CAF3693436.1 unnamed protein product [Rotaria sordida]
MLFIFQNNLIFTWIYEAHFRSTPVLITRSEIELLSLYEKELSCVENDSFQPIFHNHYLTLKLNLILMGKNHENYFKSDSQKEIDCLKITCLKNSKTINDFHSICHIYLNFSVTILNFTEVRLIFLSKNSSCLLSLTNTSDIISLDIHQMFLVDDKFRFTYQWSNFDQGKLFSWSQWPLTMKYLNSNINNLSKNKNQASKLNFSSFQCFSIDILIHSTSQELFIREQEAVSYWLDLQNNASIYKKISNRSNNSIKPRRLVPFEIAKNNRICSEKFQNWILNYQKWHENISSTINNRSMTFEEQFQRIIELDVRFLIYEKYPTGIADRIIHMISTYLVALLTNRLFIFDKNWSEFIDTMQSSLNYQPEFVVPWLSQFDIIKKNLPLNIQKNLTIRKYSFSFDRYMKDYDYEKHYRERILIFRSHTGGVIHTIKSNSSIYRKFLTMDLKMNSENIFGCLYHSLFTYRLSALIKRVPLISSNNSLGHSPQQILQTLLSSRFFPIGIQIRAGDGTMTWKQVSSNGITILKKFENFFTCSQQIININKKLYRETNQIPIIFLLSDDIEIRQAALKRWKFSLECFHSIENKCQSNNSDLNILTNSNPVFHVTYAKDRIFAFQLGIFDNFLLSLCEQHIISTNSGFGRLATFASLKLRNIYSLSLNEQPTCQNQSLPLAISGYHWSGI